VGFVVKASTAQVVSYHQTLLTLFAHLVIFALRTQLYKYPAQWACIRMNMEVIHVRYAHQVITVIHPLVLLALLRILHVQQGFTVPWVLALLLNIPVQLVQ
jgi:hypothetical protein